jgi:alkylation response protein AidB-like acyl-CoA dehydrogenase
MITYKAPLQDYQFILSELLAEDLAQTGQQGFALEDYMAIIEEAAKLCEAELLPINRQGDEQGCSFDGERVKTPEGFKAAFDQFAQGGWIGLNADAEFGGMQLPLFLNVILHEMIMASCFSFGDYVGLPQAAMKTIAAHGSEEIKQRFLPRMVSGEWSATMCMTEPQCGTDLGLISASAEPIGEDGYRLNGTKIFISGGDHDLSENIIHLVLARLPDAPEGVRGLSLFLCPKFNLNDDGEITGRNGVNVVRLEKKMGYRAASTCEMFFENAEAQLLGEPHKGLKAMFTMVNTARLLVALQGLGTSETGYQTALAYARERRQGRALTGVVDVDRSADLLLVHPDVRRMLLATRSFNDAGRALALWLAMQMEQAEHHSQADKRQRAADLVALLTPVVKASFTDLGFESCNNAMQIFGGHGYIRDNGLEQLVRDCRIAQIQEGANSIQALDLIGRKLNMHDGRLWNAFSEEVKATTSEAASSPAVSHFAIALKDAFYALQSATEDLNRRIAKDANEIGAAGVDYQKAFALVTFGWMWLKIAQVCATRTDEFSQSKCAVARYFFARELPKVKLHLQVAATGADVLMSVDEALF